MLSLEDFVELVKSSGLVEEAAWQRWHAQNAAACSDSEQMAESLVAAGLITPWHRDKLLEGKNRGFFLGRFKILGQLGAGSMGAVYLAEHTVMRHRVAIKVMASRLQGSTRHIERFEREARATAAVNHPRIVRAFDVEMSGDTPYLVMEYVEGEDLQKIVLRDGVMSPKVAAKCIRQSAEGLQAAHQAGLVHRDIKPSNILLDKSGEIHILDLGLARLDAGEEASLTMMHNSRALGTVDYLAPEQARDSHTVDARADIYSLGCTLYFLLTGHPPFPEGSLAQRIAKHQTQMPEDIRKDRPDCPRDLVDICTKMMQKKPDRRFQTMREVADALETWLANHGYKFEPGSSEMALKAAALTSGARRPVRVGSGSSSGSRSGSRPGGSSGGHRLLPSPAGDTVSDESKEGTVKGLDHSKEHKSGDSGRNKAAGKSDKPLPVAKPISSPAVRPAESDKDLILKLNTGGSPASSSASSPTPAASTRRVDPKISAAMAAISATVPDPAQKAVPPPKGTKGAQVWIWGVVLAVIILGAAVGIGAIVLMNQQAPAGTSSPTKLDTSQLPTSPHSRST